MRVHSVVAFFVMAVAATAKRPSITLPWGTWHANKYDEEGKFYTFTNIRFGKAPIGHLRFNASVYPDDIETPEGTVHDGSHGFACHQVDTNRCDCPPADCPKKDTLETAFLTAAAGPTSEDCLFLDLYVPASAFKENASLPVVVWIHGGGFLFGAKDSHENGLPLYNGTGVLQAAGNETDFIFISGNYRLGPFGWLAGPTMEKHGVPNAGLHDQMLLFQWVHDFIHLVGGDRTRISAWGESAGGSSIMFHLTANGGDRDPFFTKAVILSPGFEWQWDNTPGGNMDQLYHNFTELMNCTEGGLSCLQDADESMLVEKTQDLYDRVKCTGPYSLGPAVDGSLIRTLPAVSFAEGNFWKGMDSLIISHVQDEVSSFVPKFIDKEHDLEQWLEAFLPRKKLAPVRKEVAKKYDSGTFGSAKNRAAAILRDAFFICNTRHLYDAFENSTTTRYMMQYDFLGRFDLAVHGSDLLPLFWNKHLNLKKFIKEQLGLLGRSILPDAIIEFLAGGVEGFAIQYQKYMVSHAVRGNPNKLRDKSTPKWEQATAEDVLDNVMETGYSLLGNYFGNDTIDKVNTASICEFWTEIAINATRLMNSEDNPTLVLQDGSSNMKLPRE